MGPPNGDSLFTRRLLYSAGNPTHLRGPVLEGVGLQQRLHRKGSAPAVAAARGPWEPGDGPGHIMRPTLRRNPSQTVVNGRERSQSCVILPKATRYRPIAPAPSPSGTTGALRASPAVVRRPPAPPPAIRTGRLRSLPPPVACPRPGGARPGRSSAARAGAGAARVLRTGRPPRQRRTARPGERCRRPRPAGPPPPGVGLGGFGGFEGGKSGGGDGGGSLSLELMSHHRREAPGNPVAASGWTLRTPGPAPSIPTGRTPRRRSAPDGAAASRAARSPA